MPSLKPLFTVAALGAIPLLSGCSSAEHKLGRGLANVWEPVRMGELRRSAEQTALADGPTVAMTYGFVHGIVRTVERTAVGVFDIVTFPIPTDPIMLPVNPVFPDSQPPQMIGNVSAGATEYLGISGGAVTPFLPGVTFNPLDQ